MLIFFCFFACAIYLRSDLCKLPLPEGGTSPLAGDCVVYVLSEDRQQPHVVRLNTNHKHADDLALHRVSAWLDSQERGSCQNVGKVVVRTWSQIWCGGFVNVHSPRERFRALLHRVRTCRFQTCRANQEMGPSLGNIVLGGHEVEGDEEGEIDKSGASSSDEFEAEPQDREHKGDSSRKLKSKVKWALDSHNDPDDGSRGPIAQIRYYKDHRQQLHQKHRGLVQWRRVRKLDWMVRRCSEGRNESLSTPGIETEA